MEVATEIHPDDRMWNSGPDWYWSVGESALRCVHKALDLSWNPPVRRILDLPCGHGRVARYLRAAWPDAHISFCDIDRSGVDFCATTFHGTAIYSQPDLPSIDVGNDYDAIWVGSLFTHLDRTRTQSWLAYLCSRLSSSGVLVATFHGPAALSILDKHKLWGLPQDRRSAVLASYDTTGYGYATYPDASDYGISASKPSLIVSFAETLPGRILAYSERLWADNHDVLMMSSRDRSAGV